MDDLGHFSRNVGIRNRIRHCREFNPHSLGRRARGIGRQRSSGTPSRLKTKSEDILFTVTEMFSLPTRNGFRVAFTGS